MATKEKPARGIRLGTGGALPLLCFSVVLCVATLTLWIPAYWPVAVFEISTFLIAGMVLVLGRVPARGTYFPLLALGFIVLWGCFQLITGFTVDRFATERATMQWMTWAAVYYIGASTPHDDSLGTRLRTGLVWFGFVVSVEAILQAYLSPGKVYGLFPTGYHDFVMGPIVYHTHFAVFVETILPIALVLAVGEAKESYTFLGVSAGLLAALVVSASRAGLLIGFVEVLPQRGTYVTKFSMNKILEARFIREAIEVSVVSYLAEHVTDDIILEGEKIIAEKIIILRPHPHD